MKKRIITTEIFAICPAWLNATPQRLASDEIAKELMYATSDMSGIAGYTVIGKGAVTIELDSVEEMVVGQVASLREEMGKVRAEAESRVNMIEDKIRNLQALTYEPA